MPHDSRFALACTGENSPDGSFSRHGERSGSVSALEALRENLREAAQRDVAVRRVRRRRQRRGTALLGTTSPSTMAGRW